MSTALHAGGSRACTANTVSFYKEELGGDDRNYIHNRMTATNQSIPAVLQETCDEAIDCAKRVDAILKGRGIYAQSWNDSVRGYMAMHTTNVCYRLDDLGLGEEHPLAPYEQKIGELFERVGK